MADNNKHDSCLLHIIAVMPTVFFRRSPGGVEQGVDVTLHSESPCTVVEVAFQWGTEILRTPVELMTAGETTCRVYVPDLRAPMPVTFSVWADGRLQDQRQLDWQPQPHWEVHLVHSSHHDLGYTDLPSNVLRQHDQFLDDAVEFCRQTDDWPEDSRFHYLIEQAWSLQHYIDHRPPAQVDELMRRLRQGRIEVTALFGNQTSELCGAEELVRLLYPAFRLKRRYGFPLLTAELNDIPGMAWGLASALAGAGIHYFAPGLADYFAWGMKVRPYWDEQAVLPRNMKGAFWWEGPDGQRVLLWYEGGGIATIDLWTEAQAERDLASQLSDLFQRGYPFPLVRFKVLGAQRDNSPAVLRFSQIARQWDEQWAYPRLVISTNARFFRAFEAIAGDQLRVLRGDMPNTDYPIGAASTPLETGANRLVHDAMLSAEKLAVWAAQSSGETYPSATLNEANDCMLLFDEHTWGMAHPIGAAQEAHWSQKRELAWRAVALAQDVLVKSANRLADQVNLINPGYHVVVFNPLGWARSGLVSLPALPPAPCGRPLYWRQPETGEDRPPILVNGTAIDRDLLSLPVSFFDQPFDLVDAATGQSVPYQVVRLDDPLAARPLASSRYALGHVDPSSVSVLNYARTHLYDIVFPVEAAPSCGYKSYRFVPASQAPHFASSLQVTAHTLENRFYKIVLDEQTGAISSIFDKELGQELVDEQATHCFNQLVVRNPRTGEVLKTAPSCILPGESGPLFASLVVKSTAPGCPQATQEIVLYDTFKRIDFNNRILRDATPLLEVYFTFPFAIPQPNFAYEASGAVIRPIRDQLPGTNTDAYAVQHWVSVSNSEKAIAWCSLDAPTVILSELWPLPVSQAHHGITSPGYGHAFLTSPDQFQHGHIYSCAAINNYRTNFQPVQVADVLFRYSITSRAPQPDFTTEREFGWEVSTSLEPVLVAGAQAGSLPVTASFCQVEPANIMLLAVKQAEQGKGIVLRLAEMEGQTTHAMVTLPFYTIKAAFLTNLVEEDSQPLKSTAHQVTLTLPANGLVTVRLESEDQAAP